MSKKKSSPRSRLIANTILKFSLQEGLEKEKLYTWTLLSTGNNLIFQKKKNLSFLIYAYISSFQNRRQDAKYFINFFLSLSSRMEKVSDSSQYFITSQRNKYPDFNSKTLCVSENELRNLFPICGFIRKKPANPAKPAPYTQFTQATLQASLSKNIQSFSSNKLKYGISNYRLNHMAPPLNRSYSRLTYMPLI